MSKRLPIAAGLTTLFLSVAGPVTAASAAPSPGRPALTTTAVEARRLDGVGARAISWTRCADGDGDQCGTLSVPLDYDEPRGAQVTVALRRHAASDPDHRIGALFLNPGGPGGSGQEFVQRAPQLLSPEVLQRFDLVGMDPRGTGASTPVDCYGDGAARQADLPGLSEVLPTPGSAMLTATAHLAKRCSATPLAAAMSTTEVARDMEVVRRSLGEAQLSYLGWSYGTYLGQTYAAMYPEHLRAMVLDGVVDAEAWRGDASTRHLPMTLRMGAAKASDQALREILAACDAAGSQACGVASPERLLSEVVAQLERRPLTVRDEEGSYQLTLGMLLQDLRMALHEPDGAAAVPLVIDGVHQLVMARADGTSGTLDLRKSIPGVRRVLDRGRDAVGSPALGEVTEQENAFELGASVMCSDSANPSSPARWSVLARQESRQGWFGAYWLYQSLACAGRDWHAVDEDAWKGSFATATSAPVLVVGSTHDPATGLDAARAVAARSASARLLTATNWGHTAYGLSACATAAMDRTLVDRRLPARGTVCAGDFVPFS